MPPTDSELIECARQAQQNAYAPYSKFQVGAALLSKDDKIYPGCNIENASFGATNCAERTAVFTAVCDGAREFKKIVIIANSEDPVMPCGICRQVLFEFAPNLEIISVGTKGSSIRTNLSEIFPKGFRFKKP